MYDSDSPVDILYLLDRLEEVLNNGTRFPFGKTLISEQECLDILDQIRVAIPDEIRDAKRIARDRDELLAEARAEADALLRDADRELASRIDDHVISRAAQQRAADIEDDALAAAERARSEADVYAAQVLRRLRSQVDRIGNVLDQSLEAMEPEVLTDHRRE